jgi:hypothetical protein
VSQPPQYQPEPAYGAPPTGYGATGPPAIPPDERIRLAYQGRHDSDYIFSFWTAFGWTLLTLGVYGIYVFYQLMRRMRDHNRRRLELLDAAGALAWQQAEHQGLSDELRPNFERLSGHLEVLRQMTTDFRDPVIWTVLSVVAGGIVHVVAYIFLDQDLIKHDFAEGGAESELATIYGRLGRPLPTPDPGRVKGKHNYGGRVAATIFSCSLYLIWWLYDLMNEANRHFEANWPWEDALAQSVQALPPSTS